MKPKMKLPTIIIDTREQTPLSFTNLTAETKTLVTADYSIRGMEETFAVERKTTADLVASLTRDRARFTRELHRMKGFNFRRLLIIGTRAELASGNYQSQTKPRAILASLAAIEARYTLPVIFIANPEEAALRVEQWAYWTWREHVKIVQGKAPDSPPWAV